MYDQFNQKTERTWFRSYASLEHHALWWCHPLVSLSNICRVELEMPNGALCPIQPMD